MNGKGSKPRPMDIDKEEFNKQFDAIFGKKKGDKKDAAKAKTKRKDDK
tara:strand:+ start:1320 stop:1463 length:144 start_codon:yes stop_codon:yes gene_type:complete